MAVSLLLLPWGHADAGDLVGATYRLRGANVNGGGSVFAVSTSASPRVSGSGVSIGQGEPLGFGGSAISLSSVAPGFWPLVAGTLPNLDPDGDGLQSFFDDDDDGDGLLDPVETGTGEFVSPGDTGTSPVLFDTDGDGLGDGDEVAAGFDPTDPNSPPPTVLPALGAPATAVLAGLLGLVAARLLRARPKRRRLR